MWLSMQTILSLADCLYSRCTLAAAVPSAAPITSLLSLSGQVALPSALIGGAGQDDPHIRDLHDRLGIISRRIINNELNLPPEGERSPSPQPIYDRNGVRLNTREVHRPSPQTSFGTHDS